MVTEEVQLRRALTAFEVWRSPGRISSSLIRHGIEGIDAEFERQSSEVQRRLSGKAASLSEEGHFALIASTEQFPPSLVSNGKPIVPILFGRGNRALAYRQSVGFCGSRNVSSLGLEATARCTEAMVERDLTIVSGNAKGVDGAAHLAALRSGGSTVFALPEGVDAFRIKREYASLFNHEQTLVLSQFAPEQPWQAHAAMARNAVIFGLARALVVIEAGDRGGTLAAGRGALKMGRPVLAVDFGDSTPAGNRLLIAEGALPIRTPAALHRALDELGEPEGDLPALFNL